MELIQSAAEKFNVGEGKTLHLCNMELIQSAVEKFNVGEGKTLHLCSNIIKDKITAAVEYACSKSSIGKGVSTSEMTAAQTVMLSLLHSLISDDLWFSCLLIEVASSIEQVHLKYPKHWLLADFSFDKEDVAKAVSSLSKISDRKLGLIPQYLVGMMSSLANKYGVYVPKRFYGEGSQDVEFRPVGENEERSASPVRKIPQAVRLRMAVERDDPESIMVLVAGGADIHQLTESGDDLLHVAISKRLAKAANALLVSGAIVDSRFGKHYFTPLHIATRDNSVEMIRILTKFNTNVNQRTELGDTMLHIAAANGSNEALLELMNARLSVTNENHVGDVPLHTAARYNNVFAIEALLKANTPFDVENHKDQTPLDIAVSLGHLEATKRLLDFIKESTQKSLKSLLNKQKDDDDGYSLLHMAPKRKVVMLLVECGADIHVQSIHGYTPLHFAASKGCVEACAALIELGASVDIINKDGHSPLCLAAKYGYVSVVELLVASGAEVNPGFYAIMSPLFFALKGGHDDLAITLIHKGANINHSCGGLPPLHAAAGKGMLKVIRVMISLNVFLEDVDPAGFTPLSFAAKNDQESAISLLIEAGADVNNQGDASNTPLITAVIEGHEGAVKTLLHHGADPLIKDTVHSSMPLHFAAQLGHEKIIDILLDAGVDVNSRGKNNSTALHFAAANGRLTVVKLLLNRGANINIRNDNNHTAYCVASNNNQGAVMEMLKSKGTEF